MSLRAGAWSLPGSSGRRAGAPSSALSPECLRTRAPAAQPFLRRSQRPLCCLPEQGLHSDVPVVEADEVVLPGDSAALPHVVTSGRGMPPVVMCLAPNDPAGSRSVSVAEPPHNSGSNGLPQDSYDYDGSNVDSRGYLREMMNLSVELDHTEEEHVASEGYSSGLPPEEEAATPPPEPPEVISEARAAARELLASFDPATYIGERHHWQIVTAPEVLVAGEEAIIMFNRQQSEALRVRPRILLHYAFNNWGLKEGQDGQPLVANLVPAPMARELSDFWWARIQVPPEAYELNFVLSDGESVYENNMGMDFMFPVVEGLTPEQWQAMLAEMERKREMERMEEERRIMAAKEEEARRAAEEAERQHQEELRQQDAARGAKRAEDLIRAWPDMQSKGLLKQEVGDKVLWCVQPAAPRAGAGFTLYYNRAAGPLAWLNIPEDQALTLRWGYNWWQGGATLSMSRVAKPPKKLGVGDWWKAELEVPFQAGIVNFVLNYFEHWDNNNKSDYALQIALPEGHTFESWSAKLHEVFRLVEFEARVAAEEEARQRELRRQEVRKKALDQVLAVERRKVRHVLFTEPEIIQAGQQVTVWYNTYDTPLRDRQQVYLQAGFNRWSHKTKVGPLAMTPPDAPPVYDEYGNQVAPATVYSGSPTHWKASFLVPHDAYKMDFVFSDVPGGEGTYDNRGGYDYHLPVQGSPVKEPSLYVVHISVEMAPVAKVGGLGDVVTALGRAVKEQGHLVEVILPKYEFFNYSPVLGGQMRFETEFDWGGTRICVTTAVVENLRVWFIEPRNGFFNTQTVYGRYDDEVRFDFFCKAAMEFLLRTNRQPDILHCHDWSTAHVAKSYWEDYHPYGLWKPKVVFTIHNLNYGQKKLGEAAFYCQKFTTVSPTYAFETGGTGIIAPHVHKFCGIRNGIDNDLWDPETNPFLPAPITAETVVQGKAAARAELRRRLNLTSWNDKFIVAVVSRLTPQKGVHLIKHTAFRTLDRGGQFVLLGSAPDPKVQAEFNDLAQRMGGQDASFCFKYDEPLSHLIYAAADLIVVPSMFEPCGLTQMIAMRYGAVPIVRHTGGLKDTVFDVDFDKGRAAWDLHGSSDWERDQVDDTNGFAFEGTDAGALDYALNRAIDAWYNDRAWFHSLQQRVMLQDWSWNRPALDYIELYFAATK